MGSSEDTKVLLVGQVMIDYMFQEGSKEPILRLGGVMHAARALWAIDCPYGLAYVAPEYMEDHIQQYSKAIGALDALKIGSVVGSPNVILIGKPKEYGPQEYDYLLRHEHNSMIMDSACRAAMDSQEWTNVLMFPGGYNLDSILKEAAQYPFLVDIDVNFEPDDWATLRALDRPINTLILSTSSQLLTDGLDGGIGSLLRKAKETDADFLLFKENRGGSRLFNLKTSDPAIQIPAQTRPIMHSVGVGDCYNAVFAALRHHHTDTQALSYASCIAAEYASTVSLDDFKDACGSWLHVSPTEIAELKGICLSWEDRSEHQIYIAAPDFDFVDIRPIDLLVESLKYHNFSPRRPVKEHGQMGKDASPSKKLELCKADLNLLYECSILIVVLLYDDPGTLIEMGIALERDMPVIVYDPYCTAENLMLTATPKAVSNDLDSIMNAVFRQIQLKVSE